MFSWQTQYSYDTVHSCSSPSHIMPFFSPVNCCSTCAPSRSTVDCVCRPERNPSSTPPPFAQLVPYRSSCRAVSWYSVVRCNRSDWLLLFLSHAHRPSITGLPGNSSSSCRPCWSLHAGCGAASWRRHIQSSVNDVNLDLAEVRRMIRQSSRHVQFCLLWCNYSANRDITESLTVCLCLQLVNTWWPFDPLLSGQLKSNSIFAANTQRLAAKGDVFRARNIFFWWFFSLRPGTGCVIAYYFPLKNCTPRYKILAAFRLLYRNWINNKLEKKAFIVLTLHLKPKQTTNICDNRHLKE